MKKILFVAVDFSRWKYARSWSYPTYFSFSCELVKQGVNVDYFTFIVSQRDSWIEAQNKNIQRVLDNSKYDEVWCEAVHTPWTMQTLAQLYKAAPVRVAFVCESLNYPESVYLHHPELRNRKITVEVPVTFIGEAPAVRLNLGFLIHQMDAVAVHCFPKDLPCLLYTSPSPRD